jgi:hypothetical protein
VSQSHVLSPPAAGKIGSTPSRSLSCGTASGSSICLSGKARSDSAKENIVQPSRTIAQAAATSKASLTQSTHTLVYASVGNSPENSATALNVEDSACTFVNRLAGYRVGKVIGEGGFCKVKVGTHDLSCRPVAVKVISKVCS